MIGPQTIWMQDHTVTNLAQLFSGWALLEVKQGGATGDAAVTELTFGVGQSFPYTHRVHMRISTRRVIGTTPDEGKAKQDG